MTYGNNNTTGLEEELQLDKQKFKNRKEVLYNGYLYDVTDFIHKHPGGAVINFYTEPGEDATEAMQQFHFRSKKKVDLILKSFSRRPANEVTVVQNTQIDTKYKQMSQDFKTLFEELVAEGYFKASITQIILRFLEPACMFFLALSVFLDTNSFLVKSLLTIPLGFSLSRFGWIQHEGGHKSLTGIPRIDTFLQQIAMCFVLSGSSVWWNSEHNRHHAMPQRLHHDVDMATLPFVAFSERVVRKGSKLNKFFIKHQGILYWTVDLFLFSIASKFYLHPKTQLRKKAYFEMFMNIPSYFFMFYIGMGWYFVIYYWVSFALAVNFALSHSFLEDTDEPRHWVEYALTHTADISQVPWCDWWMGYLNYQIEHHLFPTMPQFRNKEIAHRVKALADKHKLPYIVYDYKEAVGLATANLYRVGKVLVN